MHAALETVGEGPLPASAGMDLRLNHQIVRAEFARDLFRFLRRGWRPFRALSRRRISRAIPSPDIREYSFGAALDRRAISSRNAGQQRIFPRRIRSPRRPRRGRARRNSLAARHSPLANNLEPSNIPNENQTSNRSIFFSPSVSARPRSVPARRNRRKSSPPNTKPPTKPRTTRRSTRSSTPRGRTRWRSGFTK